MSHFPLRSNPEQAARPSDFRLHPWSSVLGQSEYETIARNCMVILSRTGDTWRTLSEEEYLLERAKDAKGSFTHELPYFRKVLPYTSDPEQAVQFSRSWAEVVVETVS
jgi:hypothetical protein